MKLLHGALIWLLGLVMCLCSCSTTPTSNPAPNVVHSKDSRDQDSDISKKQVYAAAIRAIFEQDRAAFTNSFRKRIPPIVGKQQATVVRGYASTLRKLDFTRTPEDFQAAYLKHIQAWEAVGFEIENQPEADWLPYIVDFLAAEVTGGASLGNSARRFSEDQRADVAAKTAITAARREVEKTWNTIEVLALGHGVKIEQ